VNALAFVTALLALVAASLGVWNNRKIKTVHTLVNAKSDDQVNRIDQLTTALTSAGTDVPPNGKGGQR
jgi:hypothetical protein